MQIGDVDFDTAATDDYNFVFAGVADPATWSTASTRRPAPHALRHARLGRGPTSELGGRCGG